MSTSQHQPKMNLLTNSVVTSTATPNFPEKLLWKDGSITDMIVTNFDMKSETMAGPQGIKLNLSAIVQNAAVVPKTCSLTDDGIFTEAISNAQKLTKLRKQIFTIYTETKKAFAPFGFDVGICGGSIRDILRFSKSPKDIDIYLLGNDNANNFNEDPKQLYSIIQTIFRASPELNVESDRDDESSDEGYGDKLPIVRKCFFKFETLAPELRFDTQEIPCQIMYRTKKEFKDFFSLIDSFDWNICQYGLFDDKWFDLDMHTNKNELKFNTKTVNQPTAAFSLRRGFVFCDRFNLRMNSESLLFLCDFISKQCFQNVR